MATLFAYFNKTPKSSSKTSPTTGDAATGKTNSSPKESAKLPSPPDREKSTPKTSKQQAKIQPRKELKSENASVRFECGEIVWAKMEGHPWWPSMICNHPTTKSHVKDEQCHVQFFGKPPSRGWVEKRRVKPFAKDELKKGEIALQTAIGEAKKAFPLSVKERLAQVSCIPSDEEDDESMDEEPAAPQQNGVSGTGTKRSRTIDSDDDEDEDDEEVTGRKSQSKRPRRQAATRADRVKKGMKKKKRAIESDSDSGEASDYKPPSESSDDESEGSVVAEDSPVSASDPDSEEDTKAQASKKRKRPSQTSTAKPKSSSSSTPVTAKPASRTSSPALTPSLAHKLSSSAGKAATALAKFQMTPSSPAPSSGLGTQTDFVHQKLEWLKEEKRKDAHGRPMNHAEYDPRSLLVPSSYLSSKEVTPGMRQWWQIKSKNFDTVLFFKVGKFYELYHMDAVTGVKELGLIFMKGAFAHAGFPEHAYGRYSESLIQKGYKVGRIEQTETPDMMAERTKRAGGPKVVMRELCAVTTKGTKTYSFLDGNCTENDASYLLAIKEKGCDDTAGGETCYGVCFVDTSIGKFHLGQFTDDRQCSRMRTLIAHYAPAQVLIERGGITTKTQNVLNHDLMAVMKEVLNPGTEFWDASKTLKTISESTFFSESNEQTSTYETWPQTLKDMTERGLSAKDGFDLCLSALGACVWYLKKCLIADEVFSMKNFEVYTPLDVASQRLSGSTFTGKQHMILDGVTLNNLDIIMNEDGGTEGTLLTKMDHCSTAFGKRLFKQWLCTPLCNPAAINDRLNAIEDLMSMPAITSEVQEILKTIPDLERLLSKIHSMGMSSRGKDHPDSRAILYNETMYSKRKINDFLATLDGFKKTVKILKLFKDQEFSSKLLRLAITTTKAGGNFPVLDDLLSFFDHGFNHTKAKEEGKIVPQQGVNDDYDEAIDEISLLNQQLQRHLDQQKKLLGCRSIVFWGSAKSRFQLEIPESVIKQGIPEEYELQSQKKGYRRYWTPFIKESFAKITDAEDRRDSALKDTMRLVFHKFDESYKVWEKAVQCIAVLEVLLSLSVYSSQSEGVMCRPEIVLPEEENFQPFIEIREGLHPCITTSYTGDNFIPNDAVIGIPDSQEEDGENSTDQSCCVLVTGPNMGGKSTLMRQTGLIVVIAQLGCYVPAESCRLTPVDRIFTRLGAHDRIFSGESTFFVELSETSSILQHASRHSLVLLDELGRGTATYDGTAIASAVVWQLTNEVKCRTFFSTHYHSLVEEFATDPLIRLGHMACMVENEEEDGDPSKETITFLYKFVKGACPKSYGFNAARLAGMPEDVIHVAVQKARDFEETVERLKLFKLLLNDSQVSQELITQCQKIKC